MVIKLDRQRWCILKTSAGQTLRLADALAAGGMDSWTPRKTVKRAAPGNRRRYVTGERRIMIEVTFAILPGFVFARADRIDDLIRASSLPFGPYPSFSILCVGDRIPLIGDAHIAGLRAAEADASAAIAAEREAEGRDQERRARAARLGSERARRKALRQETRSFGAGEQVTVAETPSMAGMIGTVVESRGASTVIHFGGSLTIEVEAWRVHRFDVQSGNTPERVAA